MEHKYSFEKLNVWQASKNLTLLIYRETRLFPSEEKFGLVSQMRRCAISVCSNWAEGSSRKSSKDQAHFYAMAYSSLIELLNQRIIAQELSILPSDIYHSIRTDIEAISSQISSLRNSILKTKSAKRTLNL